MLLFPSRVVLLSGLIGILWSFFIPFFVIQICIDKIVIQEELDALVTIAIIAVVTFFFASSLDLVLSTLTAKLARNRMPQISLQLAVELPRILISLAAMLFYNVKFTIVACLLVALGNSVFCFLQFRQRMRQTPLDKQIQAVIQGIIPVSSRVLLSFTTLFIFLYGITLIIQNEITFGALAGFIFISTQFTISVPNIINSVIQPMPVSVIKNSVS
ncbi:MAG: hypothetical protein HY785_13030 [Oscillatoriophycideae cyanobacterium NC_groundwater_1537_Pr4_S-0.65um_50_18]|nr:hypothetical protein [Oscillatoriophycideae cyanobacterium NC_groundwater_1537_Pr4_S-0.65um_50_18]